MSGVFGDLSCVQYYTIEACIGYFGIRYILAYFLRDTGIFVFFILGYGIFRNFGIWDIGIYFGIRVK